MPPIPNPLNARKFILDLMFITSPNEYVRRYNMLAFLAEYARVPKSKLPSC